MREDESGWIFARGGEAFIAFRPLQPYTWKPIEKGGRRLFSPYLKNGVVLQLAAASEYPDFAAFQRAIISLPLDVRLDPVPAVRFRSLRGKMLEYTYGEDPKVNGVPLDYSHWPLFGGPFVEAEMDSGQLLLKYGNMRRALDFRTLTVRDSFAKLEVQPHPLVVGSRTGSHIDAATPPVSAALCRGLGTAIGGAPAVGSEFKLAAGRACSVGKRSPSDDPLPSASCRNSSRNGPVETSTDEL
jgi:hypothetical protein